MRIVEAQDGAPAANYCSRLNQISFPRLERGKVRMGVLRRTIARARELRANATATERFLWQHLRLRQIGGRKFGRPRPVGPYLVDFVCLEKRLIIEVDGGQHNTQLAQVAEWESWLRQEGYTVLRFWNHEALTQIETVKNVIWSTLNAAPPESSPRRGGHESERSRPELAKP